MEIILKQDIAKLGYTNDLISVKDGFARNYLIPQGYAILATETNKKIRDENMKQKSFKEEKIKKEAEILAKAIENITVKIAAKAATTGKIFGSVNAIQISEAIKEQFSYDVDRKRILLDIDTIKDIGVYKAKINLHKEVSVEINFEVFAE